MRKSCRDRIATIRVPECNNTLLEVLNGMHIGRRCSRKMGSNANRVSVPCKDGCIENTEKVENMRLMPEGAKKPKDARCTKKITEFNPVFFNGKKTEQEPALRPFVKWAGGKSQLLPRIREKYQRALKMGIKKYAEPFVGGGAVLFDILPSHDFEKVYISDINADLINAYRIIRDYPADLIRELSEFETIYLPLGREKRSAFYYEMRREYNEIKVNRNENDNIRKAALMIFLNRTCYNGLYRVNKKGHFNTPAGDYANPTICDRDNLTAVSKALQNVEIVCGQFTDSESFIDESTLVYFDPPYRPLSTTSSFTSYTEGDFDDDEQRRLAAYIDHLTEKGAKIIVSNSDPKNQDPADEFFDKLYEKYKIERVKASRMINSKGNSRGKISELLITNF